ncbi:acetylornithine/succinylornithine family transaminase [bacterium]|nr:acetylornithine/succinylornithine family transaminase [bacterium]
MSAQSLEQSHHFQLYKRYPITLVEGDGARVRDSEGREYIDALAGIAVNSLGHCHPKVVAAIREQAGKLIHASNLYYLEPQSRLAKRLTEAAGLERVFFTNSGTEAVEGALKLARRYAGKKDNKGATILSMEGCFHGRSMGSLSTHSDEQKAPFEQLLPGFEQLPFEDIDAFHRVVGEQTAAVLIEPVQGEGGVRPVSLDFLREIRTLCDETDTLLILDEIQCGVGRTGKLYAYMHAGIRPDILTTAKALGGGLPIGAVLARDEVASAFEFGDHGTTFGGNPLVCAAADAVLQVVEEEELAERAQVLGEHMRSELLDLARKHPSIKEIRGLGLMIGIQLDFGCKELVADMMKRGVLANCTKDSVVRFLPPLTITKEEIDTVIDVFDAALKAREKEMERV